MNQEICPKCKTRPRERQGKNKQYIRPTCWMCRIGKKTNNERNKKYKDRLQQLCLEKYGNKCACCGESIREFLAFDHVKNDGNKFREKHRSGLPTLRWIIKNNFPNSMQILCFNCNWGKHINGGICPHKTRNADVELSE